jgi:tetratricopeptide (TPR) repeat protein
LEELEKAHSCATEATKLSKQRMVGGWKGLTYLVLGLVLVRMEEQRHKEAEECIERAVMIFDEYRLRPWFANATFTLGEFYMRSGHEQKALENLKKAEEMFKEMEMDYGRARIYAFYAELFKRKGDKSKAKENLNKAIEIFQECGADGWVKKAEREWAGLL